MLHVREIPAVTLVAAEFKGLAKVGGLADVVADLSRHLSRQSVSTRVLLPCYGPPPAGASLETRIDIPFGSGHRPFSLFTLMVKESLFFSSTSLDSSTATTHLSMWTAAEETVGPLRMMRRDSPTSATPVPGFWSITCRPRPDRSSIVTTGTPALCLC